MAIAIHDPADAELVRGHLEGDAESIEVLYRRYFPRLVRMCRRRLPDQAAAEDVAQDALLRAISHLDGFDLARPMWPWLKVIATNLIADRGRSLSREEAMPEIEPVAGLEPSPEEELERSHERALLSDALQRLPSRQRAAVALRYVEDWDPSEAAQFLGLTAPAFAQLLFRARRRLRMEYRRLSTAAPGLVLVPLGWLRRLRDRVAIRMQTVSSMAGPGGVAASSAASQLVAGVVVAALVAGTGVSTAATRRPRGPAHVRLVDARGQRVAPKHAPGHGTRHASPTAPTAPVHRMASSAPDPVSAAQPVLDPNHNVRRPEQARLTSIQAAPGSRGRTLYAAGTARCVAATCPPVLFRSTDGGATWTRLDASDFQGSQLLLPPDPNDHRIFAMGDAGLDQSSDGGRTFRPAAALDGSLGLGSGAISPAFDRGDRTILIGSQTLMKYDDGSGAIEPMPYPLTAPLQPAYSPNYLHDQTVFVGAVQLDPVTRVRTASVFICTQVTCSGTELGTWSESPKLRVAQDFANDPVVLAFGDGWLFRSEDAAKTFSPVRRFWGRGWLADLAVGEGLAVAGVGIASAHHGVGLYLSRDGGATWIGARDPLLAQGVRTVSVIGSRIVVGLQHAGIACSTDGGNTWARRCGSA